MVPQEKCVFYLMAAIEATVSPVRIRAGTPTDLVIRLTNAGLGPCTNVNLAVRLPAGFVRLRGKTKMRWAVLSPGESVSETIQVKAAEAGTYRRVRLFQRCAILG